MPDGLRVTTDEPYRILVVSDLAGPGGSLAAPLADGVVKLTADNFDEVLAAASPSLNFTIADPVKPGGAMVEVSLRFDSLGAFNPRDVAAQLPGAAALMDVRDRIVVRMRGQASAADLAAAIAKAASSDESLSWLADAAKASPAAAAPDNQTVNSLLDQFDLGEGDAGSAAPPRSPIGSLVSAAAGAGAGIPAEEASALRRALGEIDRRVGAWLTAVLHAPQVQAVESAWRALAWLTANTDFRKGIRLSVLHAARDAAVERFVARVIDPVFDEGAESPNVVVADWSFGNSAPDVETLDGLAQQAASLPAVVLAGLSPGFFGVKHAWQIATLPPIVNLVDQWQFAKWKTLRGRPYARNLGVVFGRCLMRVPFGRDEARDLDFNFREPCIGEQDLVWASGAMAGAYTIARGMADTGWPSGMAGRVHGRIEGLPCLQAGKSGDKWFGPTDAQVPQPRVEEMGMAGVNAVVSTAGQADALLWNGLTAARPARTESNALLEVSLPYQLFAGRLSTLMWELKPSLEGKSPEKVIASVRAHLCDWLQLGAEPTPEQMSVQVRPVEDAPGTLQLAATVTPPPNILPGGIPVVLGYTLGRA